MDSDDALDTSPAFLTNSPATTTNTEECSVKHSLMPNQYFYPYEEDLKEGKNDTKLPPLAPPPSHLRDALVKEEEENSVDNVEKTPKRRKNKREIIRPDPKYKGWFRSLLQILEKYRIYIFFSLDWVRLDSIALNYSIDSINLIEFNQYSIEFD